jgi:phosphohistidine phosphatase
MKTLYLLRHAKSDWKDAEMRDFDRPLAPRGRHAAALIGKYLRKQDIRPDLIVCSPAERARETIEIVLENTKLKSEVRFDERIYEAHTGRLLEIIAQLDESARSALMIGHNSGFEELGEHLTGQMNPMPTGALLEIDLDVEKWRQVREGCGRLRSYIKPKDLEEQ